MQAEGNKENFSKKPAIAEVVQFWLIGQWAWVSQLAGRTEGIAVHKQPQQYDSQYSLLPKKHNHWHSDLRKAWSSIQPPACPHPTSPLLPGPWPGILSHTAVLGFLIRQNRGSFGHLVVTVWLQCDKAFAPTLAVKVYPGSRAAA